jgi:excisionase family DNA binding protein
MMAIRDNPTRSCLLTVKQAAEMLAISRRTLERLMAGGEFPPPMKIGRSSRVPAQDVDAFLERLNQRRLSQGGTS